MTVTVEQAQAGLADLIRQLPPGGQVVITDGDRPVATLTPVPPASPPRREPGLAKGMIVILEDDDEHLKDFEEYMS